MTYKNALKVKSGDVLHSKDGFTFTVNEITEKSNVANTEKYLYFKGVSTRGIIVYYSHKQII
jgi:hypothetical protein